MPEEGLPAAQEPRTRVRFRTAGGDERRYTPWEAIVLPSLRNVTFALLVAVLFGGLAAAFTLTRPKVFESSATIELHEAQVFTEPGPGPIVKLQALRLKYASIVATDPIVSPIAKKLSLTNDEVRSHISALVPPESLLIRPTARSSSPDQAKKLAQALTDTLVAFAKDEQDADKVPAAQRVDLRVLDTARGGQKVTPTVSTATASAGVAGLVALGAVYVILQLATARKRLG